MFRELTKVALSGPQPHVLLDGETLIATDLATWLSVPVALSEAAPQTCFYAHTLARATKGAQAVTFTGQSVVVDGTKIELLRMSGESFPSFPVIKNVVSLGEYPAKSLREALAWVLLVASKDITRKPLNAALIDHEVVVAIDGHRLHLAPFPIPLETLCLISRSSVEFLVRVLKETTSVTVYRTDDMMWFRCPEWELGTTLLTEEFPPYGQVVPAKGDWTSQASFDAKVLSSAVKRAVSLTSNPSTWFEIKESRASLSLWDSGVGDVEIEVAMLNYEGKDIKTGVNGRYLLDALPAKGTIEISMKNPLDPIRVDLPDGKISIIMPLRL